MTFERLVQQFPTGFLSADEIEISKLDANQTDSSSAAPTTLITTNTTTTQTQPLSTTPKPDTTITNSSNATSISEKTTIETEPTTTTTTNTTSYTEPPHLTTKKDLKIVYYCNFDNNDRCGGKLYTTASGVFSAFSATQLTHSIGIMPVTDYTSISETFFHLTYHLTLNKLVNYCIAVEYVS